MQNIIQISLKIINRWFFSFFFNLLSCFSDLCFLFLFFSKTFLIFLKCFFKFFLSLFFWFFLELNIIKKSYSHAGSIHNRASDHCMITQKDPRHHQRLQQDLVGGRRIRRPCPRPQHRSHLLTQAAPNPAEACGSNRRSPSRQARPLRWAEQASTLIAELKQEISVRQLQPPTHQLQLPEGSATRRKLDLVPAPIAQVQVHTSLRCSVGPKSRFRMEVHPRRSLLQPDCTIPRANSDLRIAILSKTRNPKETPKKIVPILWKHFHHQSLCIVTSWNRNAYNWMQGWSMHIPL